MKNKIHTLTFAILVLILTLSIPLQAQSTEYYVDKDHPSASDTNPGTEVLPWKTITKANQTLNAGDKVYIKAGTYTAGSNNYIKPVNSGTFGSRITYRNYGNDIVTIQNGDYAILLNGNDYITVLGFNFYNLDRFMVLRNSADYNIIEDCTLTTMRTYGDWAGSRIYQNSDHNIIRNSTFSTYGYCSGDDIGNVLEIGNENVSTDHADYNLIEDNTFSYGGHHVLGVNSRFNVVRNNYIHNDAWTNGYGNRNLYSGGVTGGVGYNLIENNRIGYAAEPCDARGTGGALIASSYNILRYNSFYHNNLYGISFGSYSGVDNNYNMVYNNTFFNNSYDPQPDWERYDDCAILFNDWQPSDTKYNVFKNNLYYKHTAGANPNLYDTNGASLNDQTFANEFNGDVTGNPLFVNASTTPAADKTDSSLPNLNLQSSSPAINAGGALTTVSSGCTGVTSQIVLADASYFQDGTWGVSSEVDADWIAVGTVSNVVQISSISNNTVDLVSPISCSNGNEVWLYKDSDGTQVLYGSAPDAGAYEFLQAAAPSPPKNLRIVE